MYYDKYDDIKWNADDRNKITQINETLNKRRDGLKFRRSSLITHRQNNKVQHTSLSFYYFFLKGQTVPIYFFFNLKLYQNTAVK